LLGSTLALAAVAAILWPGLQHWRAPGPMNVGHEQLECGSCHRPAPGTVRQQLQANTRALFGVRAAGVDFGMRRVGNAECRGCHDRPDDRHPSFRFLEPRFAEVRASLGPHECTSCHREHSGRRVTAPVDLCRHCHDDVRLEHDPLSTPHVELARADAWATCLGCHDFHGNHAMAVPTELDAAAPPESIEAYLAGEAAPWPGDIRHPALDADARGGDEP